MGKSFFDYLIESKQLYEFKIKIAGDIQEDAAGCIHDALVQFDVESCLQSKRTPIQKVQTDFPSHKNVRMTIFTVVTNYPATSPQIRVAVADALGLTHDCVVVHTAAEADNEEIAINNTDNKRAKAALLLTDYDDDCCNQKLVGTKQVMSLLKDLDKVRHQGKQYKGVNDELLAKKMPRLKDTIEPLASSDKIGNKSPVGSTKIKRK